MGVNEAGDFKLKPMLSYQMENPRTLKNFASSNSVYNMVYWIFCFHCWDLLVRKSIPFKWPCSLIMYLATQEIWLNIQEMNLFIPATAASILQFMDQGVILTFKFYYLSNTFHNTLAAIDSDPLMDLSQVSCKSSWKCFTILDFIKNICDSWKDVKISTLTGVWKKLTPTFYRWLWGNQDFQGRKQLYMWRK